MEQVRWEDSGAAKHLGEAIRLSCIPKQEMLVLATVTIQRWSPGQLGKLKEGKSGKLELHDRQTGTVGAHNEDAGKVSRDWHPSTSKEIPKTMD